MGWRVVDDYTSESGEARRARYARMAIAAAVAAAHAPLPEVRLAYLLIAESWSNLSKGKDESTELLAQETNTSPPSTVDQADIQR